MSQRIALVSGAASGIGLASARRLHADGWKVVGLDRDPLDGEVFAAGASVDVRDEAGVRTAVSTLLGESGRLDAVVCSAGIAGSAVGDGPVRELTGEAFDNVVGVNLRGAALVVSACWPALKRSAGGIVLVSSVLGLTGGGGPFRSHAYAMSKGGIVSLTRALAADGRADGIRANCVAPGLVDTPFAGRARTDPEVRSYVEARQPLTGGPIPADAVAGAVAFLCSPDAAAITGQVLAVDAGWGLDPA